jgi:precorrin-2/cobalt-factor-2 C20-methyltransferase
VSRPPREQARSSPLPLGEGWGEGVAPSPVRAPRRSQAQKGQELGDDASSRPFAGTLYGIGLGPGDPELITVKGLRLLREAAVVFLPVRSPGQESYAGVIAANYLDRARQEIVSLVFPSGRGERDEARWAANADLIASRLAGGRLGVFLTEGDPLLYSTFVHVLLPLRERHPEVTVDVVPGVWSGSAAAAALGEPLVDGDERLAIIPAAYAGPELRAALGEYDTLVLLKAGTRLGSLRRLIGEVGARAVWVQRVGRPEQRVERDLSRLRTREADYFTLLIVRGGRHCQPPRREQEGSAET